MKDIKVYFDISPVVGKVGLNTYERLIIELVNNNIYYTTGYCKDSVVFLAFELAENYNLDPKMTIFKSNK